MRSIDEHELAHWFRAQGLPTLVPASQRGHDLWARAAPLAVVLSVSAAADEAAGWLLTRLPFDRLSEFAAVAFVILAFALAFALPIAVGLGVRRLLQRTRTNRTAVAIGAIVAAIVLSVLLYLLTAYSGLDVLDGSDWTLMFAESVGLAILAVIAIRIGLGALVVWALRSVLAHLRGAKHLASTAVPVIFTLVIFAFFSAETWQLTDTLRWPRLFFVGGVIAVIAALFITPVVVRDVAATQRESTVVQRARLLGGTPLHRAAIPPMGTMQPLTRLQRFNVITVLTLTQLILATVFAVIQWILLLVIGQVALTDETVKAWLTHPPVPAKIFDVALPYSSNLLKAAAFLSLVSALLFVISTVTDSENRSRFLDPIFTNVRRALVVNATYRSVVEQIAPPAEQPVPTAESAGADQQAAGPERDDDGGDSGATEPQ